MKEQEPINNQNKLTSQPNSSNLEREGDIFMPEPGRGEIPQNDQSQTAKKPLSEEQAIAREALGKLRQPDEGASLDERSSYRIFREVLVERAGFLEDELKGQEQGEGIKKDKGEELRTGSATWKSKDNDLPIKVTGYRGKGPDGRDYISIEGSETGVLLDEVEFVFTGREKEIKQIIEDAKDFYSAFEEIIKTATPETAKDIIDNMGEAYIRFLASGLSRNSYEKHLESLKKLKESSPGEAREQLVDILRDIRDERKGLSLEDPLTHNANQEAPRLTEEEIKEQTELQKKGADKESDENIKEEKRNKRELTSEETVERLRRLARGERVDEPTGRTQSENKSKANGEGDEEAAFVNSIIKDVAGRIMSLSIDSEDLDTNVTFFEIVGGAGLGELLVVAYGIDSKEFKLKQQELARITKYRNLSTPESIQQIQEKLFTFLNATTQAIRVRESQSDENPYKRITSVQELSKWIIRNQDSELWGVDGVYPLLDKDNNFNQANFLIWLREESVKHHENNPNSEMTPLSSVGISTDYRDISVYAMSLLREQYMKNTNDGGKVLADLAGQLIHEGFMFGELRTMALIYSQSMGDDRKIDQLLQQVHLKNSLTRPDNLKGLMRMPEEFGKAGDTRVGDAFRIATDIFNNISDKEILEQILGNDKITIDDFKNAFRILNKLKDWDSIDEGHSDYGEFHYYNEGGLEGFTYRDEDGIEISLFDSNGDVGMDKFSDIMNIWNAPSEHSTKLELVRELVRLKASQKAGLRMTGMAFSTEAKLEAENEFKKQVKILVDSGETEEQAEKIATEKFMLLRYGHRSNIRFAETMAYSMQRPYGSAAKQDLKRAAYDAATKFQAEDYLAKNSDPESGGTTGIPEQIGLFKDLSPDPLTGIRTESGRSISEIMRDLRDIDNGKEEVIVIRKKDRKAVKVRVTKDELLDELKFRENAERSYTQNQQVRAVQIYHTLMDGKALDLSKIVTYSVLEGVKYNPGEFQEQVTEGIIKPFRYAFRNSNINFGEQVRMYEKETGKYKTVFLARKTLGDELYRKLEQDYYEQRDTYSLHKKDSVLLREKYKDDETGPGFEKFLASRDANTRVAKNASLGMFAAQLRSHRKLNSIGQSWSYNRTETFIDALKTIQAYEKNPETGRYEPSFDKNGNPVRYYNDKDIKWLRESSGTGIWRMLAIDAIKETGPEALGGVFDGLMKFVQAMVK